MEEWHLSLIIPGLELIREQIRVSYMEAVPVYMKAVSVYNHTKDLRWKQFIIW
jgi:hypothetical protein